MKVFFPVNVEWGAENLWKIRYADVKANKIKDIVAVSYKLLKEAPSKLEMQCKRLHIFHFILVGILYCPLRTGVSDKAICQDSLK